MLYLVTYISHLLNALIDVKSIILHHQIINPQDQSSIINPQDVSDEAVAGSSQPPPSSQADHSALLHTP